MIHTQQWIILFALIAGMFTLFPVHAGMQHAAETGRVFNGFDFVEDSHAYAAYIHSGVEENPIFLKDYSTSEPQKGVYVILLFSIIAIKSSLTGLSIDLLWNVLRLFIILFLAWSVWKFCQKLFTTEREQMVGFILVLFGGGLAWTIYVFGGILPFLSRLYSTELQYYLGYTVFSFLFHPLAMLSLAFIFLAARSLLTFTTKPHILDIAYASGFILLAFFNHPAAGVFGFILAAVYLFLSFVTKSIPFSRKTILDCIPFVLAGIIALLYVLWARTDLIYAFHQDFYIGWAKNEPIWMYPFAMGIPFVLALYTLATKHPFFSADRKKLLASWFGIGIILTALFPAGVKYLYLLFPAVALLAVPSLLHLVAELGKHLSFFRSRGGWAVVVILCCLSVPFVTHVRTNEVVNQDKYYLSHAEGTALDFLSTQGSGVILSDKRMGSMMSWTSPQRPLLAHAFLTYHFPEKQVDVQRFFSNDITRIEKEKIIQKYALTHVYYGTDEKALGSIDPSLPLESIFQNDTVQIFRVLPESVK